MYAYHLVKSRPIHVELLCPVPHVRCQLRIDMFRVVWVLRYIGVFRSGFEGFECVDIDMRNVLFASWI